MATRATSRSARGPADPAAPAVHTTPEALQAALAAGLAPVVWIGSAEPLLALEAAAWVRQRAREAGYDEREVIDIGSGFDGSILTGAAQSRSLFGNRRLLELRLRGKPGRELCETLAQLAPKLDADTRILVQGDRLDGQQQRSHAFRDLAPHLIQAELAAPTAAQFPQWLGRALRQQNQSLDEAAMALLIERTEGNLVAARQALQRLALLAPAGAIDRDTLESVVMDDAQYEVFTLVDCALQGEPERLLRVLDALRVAQAPLPLVSWALADTLRKLIRARQAMAEGRPIAQALRAAGVYGNREAVWSQALRRLTIRDLWQMLRETAYLDKMSKGVADGVGWMPHEPAVLPPPTTSVPALPWVAVERIVLGMAGLPRLSPH